MAPRQHSTPEGIRVLESLIQMGDGILWASRVPNAGGSRSGAVRGCWYIFLIYNEPVMHTDYGNPDWGGKGKIEVQDVTQRVANALGRRIHPKHFWMVCDDFTFDGLDIQNAIRAIIDRPFILKVIK